MTNKYIEEIVEKNLNKKYKHLQKEIERVVAIALTSANKENLKVINNLIKDYNGKLKAREVIIERANKK